MNWKFWRKKEEKWVRVDPVMVGSNVVYSEGLLGLKLQGKILRVSHNSVVEIQTPLHNVPQWFAIEDVYVWAVLDKKGN